MWLEPEEDLGEDDMKEWICVCVLWLEPWEEDLGEDDMKVWICVCVRWLETWEEDLGVDDKKPSSFHETRGTC